MARFEVDVEALQQLARTLTDVGVLLAAAPLTAQGGPALGNERVAAALDRFTRRWAHGVRQLGEASDTAGRLAAGAARHYQDVDSGLAHIMTGSS